MRYLGSQGWGKATTKRMDLLKYRSPTPINEDNEYFEVLVPLNDKIRDFYRMVELAIDNISVYYGESFNNTLSKVLYFGDAFEVGVISENTIKGAIPIPRGIALYESWRDLIGFGICASLSPLTKKFSRKNSEAIEYIGRSLIGRNSPGSFIATIYCPLPTSRRFTIDGDLIDPPGRIAVLHITRRLQHLSQSIAEGCAEPIIKNYCMGFNYNMCGSLLNLIDIGGEGKLNVGVTLEPSWDIPEDIIITRFILDSSCKKYLEEARDALNEDQQEEEPLSDEQELEGIVLQLKRDPSEDERTIRLAAITKEIPEMLSVKTVLDEDMYQIAIEAHRTQQKISIKGSLERGKKFWLLRNPSNLKVIGKESRPEKALDHF